MILLNFSGFSQFDPELIQNVSDFPASKALDNGLETYYHSESKSNASWFLKLTEVKVITFRSEEVIISIRLGVHIYMYMKTLHRKYG